MANKHYNERRHQKTHKGPAQPKGKMSRKAFRTWVRASQDPSFVGHLPIGYGPRAYCRVAGIETNLVVVRLSEYSNGRTFIRRPKEN